MKLIVAIVQDREAGRVVDELVAYGVGVTRINTAGAFWKRNNATILTGVEDSDVDCVIEIYRRVCGQPNPSPEQIAAGVLFVLPVAAALKI